MGRGIDGFTICLLATVFASGGKELRFTLFTTLLYLPLRHEGTKGKASLFGLPGRKEDGKRDAVLRFTGCVPVLVNTVETFVNK